MEKLDRLKERIAQNAKVGLTLAVAVTGLSIFNEESIYEKSIPEILVEYENKTDLNFRLRQNELHSLKDVSTQIDNAQHYALNAVNPFLKGKSITVYVDDNIDTQYAQQETLAGSLFKFNDVASMLFINDSQIERFKMLSDEYSEFRVNKNDLAFFILAHESAHAYAYEEQNNHPKMSEAACDIAALIHVNQNLDENRFNDLAESIYRIRSLEADSSSHANYVAIKTVFDAIKEDPHLFQTMESDKIMPFAIRLAGALAEEDGLTGYMQSIAHHALDTYDLDVSSFSSLDEKRAGITAFQNNVLLPLQYMDTSTYNQGVINNLIQEAGFIKDSMANKLFDDDSLENEDSNKPKKSFGMEL